jgi:hypothetical protein
MAWMLAWKAWCTPRGSARRFSKTYDDKEPLKIAGLLQTIPIDSF